MLEGGGRMAEKSARSNETEIELTLDQAKENYLKIGKKHGTLTYEGIAGKFAHL